MDVLNRYILVLFLVLVDMLYVLIHLDWYGCGPVWNGLFIMLRHILCIPSLFRTFIVRGYCNFHRPFLHLMRWCVIFVFQSVYVVDYLSISGMNQLFVVVCLFVSISLISAMTLIISSQLFWKGIYSTLFF